MRRRNREWSVSDVQTRRSYLNILFPVGLIFIFLLEGCISKIFGNVLYGEFPMVAYLTLLWIAYASMFEDFNHLHLYWWAFGIGLVYDMYYVGVIGVFTFLFPLIVFVNKFALKYLEDNILTGSFLYGIDTIIVSVLSYLADSFAKIASLSVSQFLIYTLLPTLVLNVVIFAIFYFPVRWLYNRLR